MVDLDFDLDSFFLFFFVFFLFFCAELFVNVGLGLVVDFLFVLAGVFGAFEGDFTLEHLNIVLFIVGGVRAD